MLTLFLVVLGVVAVQAPGWAQIAPLLSLTAIYHWAVYRSDLMPGYAVFFIGFLQDALSGTPIGLMTLVYLSVYGVIVSQQRYLIGKSFSIIWLGFALVSAGAMGMAWMLYSLLSGVLVEPRALCYQYLLGIGLYPVLARFFLASTSGFYKLVEILLLSNGFSGIGPHLKVAKRLKLSEQQLKQ